MLVVDAGFVGDLIMHKTGFLLKVTDNGRRYICYFREIGKIQRILSQDQCGSLDRISLVVV